MYSNIPEQLIPTMFQYILKIFSIIELIELNKTPSKIGGHFLFG